MNRIRVRKEPSATKWECVKAKVENQAVVVQTGCGSVLTAMAQASIASISISLVNSRARYVALRVLSATVVRSASQMHP